MANRPVTKRTFISRWGDPDLDDKQYVTIPGFVLRNYHKLGLTADEFQVMAHIMSFKYDTEGAQACPSLATIAIHVGRHVSSIRRTIRRLREDRKVLTVIERPGLSSVYDFGELIRQCREHELSARVDAPIATDATPSADATPSTHATPSVDAKGTPSVDASTPLAYTLDEDQKEESEDKSQKIAVASKNDATARAAEPKAKTPKSKARPRDPMFDAIAQGSFGVPVGAQVAKDTGARVGRVKRELLTTFPELTVEQLQAAYSWHTVVQMLSAPRDSVKVVTMVGEYFKMFPRNGSASAPAPKPRPDCEQCGGTGLIIAVHPDGREETVPCPECRAAAEGARKEEAVHA